MPTPAEPQATTEEPGGIFDIKDPADQPLPPRDDKGRFTKPEEETPPTEPTKPTVHDHHPALTEAALEFLTQEEIDATHDKDLYPLVIRLQKAAARERDRIMKFNAVEASRTQVRPQEPAPQPEVDEDEAELQELERQGFSGAVLKQIRSVKALSATNQKLQEELEQLKKREQQFAQSRRDDMIDAAFAGLGEQYHSLFGQGAISELDENSAQRKRRNAVFAYAGLTDGDSIAIMRKKLKATADELWPTQPQKPAKAEPPSLYPPTPARNGTPANGMRPFTTAEWEEGTLRRPTSREVQELPEGDERAVRNLQKRMGSNLPAPVSNEAAEEGFPE